MPPRRKAQLKARRKKRKSNALVVPRPWVMPPRLFTRMTFVIREDMDGSSNDFNYVTYRGNSIFDPNETAVLGQQPLYRDELTAIYNQYRVHASSISVEACSTSAAGNVGVMRLIVLPSKDIATSHSTQAQVEYPYAKSRVFGPSTGNAVVKIHNRISVKKMLGYKDISQIDSLQSLGSTNPAQQFYWIVKGQTLDGSLAPNYSTVTRITYDVELFNLKSLDQS